MSTRSTIQFDGHEAPILGVAFSHDVTMLASSSCDGSVRVWDLKTHSCVKTLKDLFPSSGDTSLSKTLCRLSWSPCDKVTLSVKL